MNDIRTNIKSVYMHCNKGSSDKFYNIYVLAGEGKFEVIGEGGRTGSRPKEYPRGSYYTMADAAHVVNGLIKEKLGKDYIITKHSEEFSYGSDLGDLTYLTHPSKLEAKEVETFRIFPQLLTPISVSEMLYYITNDQYIAQEKIDGQRIMIEVDFGKVTAYNRKACPVEIPEAMKDELAVLSKQIVLDGEKVGDMYYIFDMLEESFEDMTKWKYESRFSHLLEIMEDRILHHIDLVPTAISIQQKQKLVEQLMEENKEGVVFKLKTSVHTAGRGPEHLKCKFWSSATCSVTEINYKRSVGVSVQSGDELVPVGNVTVPPNYDLPSIGDLVEVKYLYYYPGGSLYQPQYLGVRNDVEVDSLSSLKPKAS